MLRNTPTTIDELLPGDRFYKAFDKKKLVWTVVAEKAKRTHFQTYKFFAIRDGMKYPEPINKHTTLIFLKHQDHDNKTHSHS